SRAFGSLGFTRGNRSITEQSLLTASVRAEKLQLRFESFGVLLRGFDLRLGKLALRIHFRGDEPGEGLIFFEDVALLDKQLHHSTTGERRNVHFVDFECA